jgi:hypothetical protein
MEFRFPLAPLTYSCRTTSTSAERPAGRRCPGARTPTHLGEEIILSFEFEGLPVPRLPHSIPWRSVYNLNLRALEKGSFLVCSFIHFPPTNYCVLLRVLAKVCHYNSPLHIRELNRLPWCFLRHPYNICCQVCLFFLQRIYSLGLKTRSVSQFDSMSDIHLCI